MTPPAPPTYRRPALRRAAFPCPGRGKGGGLSRGGREMGKVCRHTYREQRRREHARTRPPGDPERGKHLGPERKRTTPAPPPGDRPGDRETETGLGGPSSGVYRRNPCPKARRPPRFGIGLPPPKRQSPHAPLHIHLSYSAPGTAPTYFILISKRPGGSPWRTEPRLRLDTRVVGLRSGRRLTERSDASGDKCCVIVLTKLRKVW